MKMSECDGFGSIRIQQVLSSVTGERSKECLQCVLAVLSPMLCRSFFGHCHCGKSCTTNELRSTRVPIAIATAEPTGCPSAAALPRIPILLRAVCGKQSGGDASGPPANFLNRFAVNRHKLPRSPKAAVSPFDAGSGCVLNKQLYFMKSLAELCRESRWVG